MDKLRLNLIFLLILSTSCNVKTDKNEIGSYINDSVNNDSKIDNGENSIDYFKRANDFALKILGDKIRIHEFTAQQDKPSYLKIFPSAGLIKVIAFSNKDYPKQIEPNYYEHFTLFCFEYKSMLHAEHSFKELSRLANYDLKKLDSLDSLTAEKVKFMIGESKSGGFILQKGNWLFSLVETCRDTPIGGTWVDYENLFISFISVNRTDTMTVLDADCGNMKFIEKQIKPVHNRVGCPTSDS
jgi:hypothetical protein